MSHRRPPVTIAVVAVLALLPPAAAVAQTPGGAQLPGLPQAPIDGVGTPAPTSPEADPVPTTPASGATAPAPSASAPAGEQSTTPEPPLYLVPGASAQGQPISSVAELSDADVPLEPIRTASLIATLLAALLIAAATALRSLGLRTPVVDPVAPPRTGPGARAADRLRATADDMRDFLRRRR